MATAIRTPKVEPVGGDPAVDDRSEADAEEQVGPDLSQNGADLFDAHADAVVEGQPGGRVNDLSAQGGLEDEWLDPAFEVEPTDGPSRDDGDDEAGADVDRGDLPAEEGQQ